MSPDIPWHATAFHKDYKMTDPDNTSGETLMRAAEIGRKSGLRYIYVGNLPGEVGDLENTRCPNCQQLLIERYGYLITGYFLTREGSCWNCGTAIPGRWAPEFQVQITAYPYLPHRSMGTRLVSILSSPTSQRLTAFISPATRALQKNSCLQRDSRRNERNFSQWMLKNRSVSTDTRQPHGRRLRKVIRGA